MRRHLGLARRGDEGEDGISGVEIAFSPSQGSWPGMMQGGFMGPQMQFGRPMAMAPLAPGAAMWHPPNAIAFGPGGTQAYQQGAGHIKRYLLPISPGFTAIAAGTTAIFSVNSQRAFRVERLVLATDEAGGGAIASGCLVTALDVGATPQLAAAGGIPVTLFAAQAVFTASRGDTASPGKVITISIQNPTAATVHVAGAFIGESLDV
jgi:hypothetical protein